MNYKTNIPTKSTGDDLTAIELNELNDKHNQIAELVNVTDDVTFAMVADFQINDADNVGDGQLIMADTLAMFQKFNPEFFVHLGDMTDPGADVPSLTYAQQLLTPIVYPKYIVVGNHDAGPDDIVKINNFYDIVKDSYYENPLSYSHPVDRLGYYHVFTRGIHLFVLNTNQVATNDGEWQLDSTQEAWLQSELNALTGSDKRVLITSHVNIAYTADNTYHNIDNAQSTRLKAMLATWEASNGIVLGCFCGHDPDPQHNTINDIEYFIMAQSDFRDIPYNGLVSSMAFSIITWKESEKKLIITGYGKQSSYELDYSDKV